MVSKATAVLQEWQNNRTPLKCVCIYIIYFIYNSNNCITDNKYSTVNAASLKKGNGWKNAFNKFHQELFILYIYLYMILIDSYIHWGTRNTVESLSPASPSVGRPLLPPSSWRSVQHSGHAPQPCHIRAPDTWEPRKVSVGLQVCFMPWVLHKTHDVTIALWATLLKSFKHDETSGTWNFEISWPAVSPGHRLPPRHQAMCPRASTSLAAARRTNLARAVVPWMFRKERLHLSYSVMIQGLWHVVAEIWPTGSCQKRSKARISALAALACEYW